MPKTLVRPATSTDFPTLLRIDQGCFPAGIAYDAAELFYYMKRPGARTLVVEVHEHVAGFLVMEVLARRRCATMVTLDIREEHRRRGCATRLLQTSEQILRSEKIRQYELQVDVGNSAALEFYRKHGFEIVRVLSHYYPNGNDAYFMVKQLDSERTVKTDA